MYLPDKTDTGCVLLCSPGWSAPALSAFLSEHAGCRTSGASCWTSSRGPCWPVPGGVVAALAFTWPKNNTYFDYLWFVKGTQPPSGWPNCGHVNVITDFIIVFTAALLRVQQCMRFVNDMCLTHLIGRNSVQFTTLCGTKLSIFYFIQIFLKKRFFFFNEWIITLPHRWISGKLK